MKEGTEVLFEPTYQEANENSLYAACIAKLTNGKIPVHVTNLAQEAVKMYPETRVGRVIEQQEEVKETVIDKEDSIKYYEPILVNSKDIPKEQCHQITALFFRNIFTVH